ncbi:uncharacterized protein DUF4329 [Pseudomonas poae]|uniref:Uncharacterized protein DUF4329 n=2 Tax=Pseudomonas TaxID=286 RepID=A0A7Z1K1W3_9PSED|nr:uncharacterized protein DUF4329 [Pseudomonas poae]PUB46240.1 uncharacterized protein DUF4329 [Pseudomonas sp. GV047]
MGTDDEHDQGSVMQEHLSREERAAARGLRYTLSPGFISADDAARYVHERIGDKRDREYGSVILQRLADSKVFATEPIPGKAATFDFSLLLERGAQNEFLDPAGYKLVGGVHSHPDQFAQLKALNPGYRDRQVRIFNSFFSTRDVVFNHYEGRAFGTAYLSGPQGVLLKYQPGFSEAERKFVDWIDDVSTAVPADGHDGTLEGFIRKVASVGRLSLLVASDDWGGVPGVIDQRWRPYLPLNSGQPTIACGAVYPEVTQALNAVQARMRRMPNVSQMALLLKHELRDEFAATQPFVLSSAEQLPTDNHLPLLAGGPPLPEGFHLQGFFYLSRPVPAQFPTVEPWLYQQFFSPRELAAYIAKARRYMHTAPSVLGISLYLRTKDNALLRYRFSGSPAETRLFTTDEPGLDLALAAGTLTPRQFVKQVAEAGELSVEQTSPLWDVEGVVENNWTPYARFPFKQASLGQAFSSADKAAQFAHAQVGERRDRAYVALILKHPDQHFVLTQLLQAGTNPYGFQGFYPWDAYSKQLALPGGYQLHAWFGSHMALSWENLDADFKTKWTRDDASVYFQGFTDVEAHRIHQLRVPGYLSGAADSLLVLEPEGADQAAFTRLFAPAPGGSLIARDLADGTYAPAEGVRKLAGVSRLRVVLGNALWGPPGAIDRHWRAFAAAPSLPSAATAVASLPALSPAFVSADDAALWAHRRIGTRREREFGGVILKKPGGHFFATEPQVSTGVRFDFLTLLGTDDRARFIAPPSYECQGFYRSYPAEPGEVERYNPGFNPDQVALTGSFFSNADQVFALSHRDFTPVHYLSGPDGALLKYTSSGSQAEQSLLRQLTGIEPAQPLTAFEGAVWNLAQAGDLRVVVGSKVWGGVRGRVLHGWTLGSPVTSVQDLPFFTPLLSMGHSAVLVALSSVDLLGQAAVGVVLKHRTTSNYIATLPAPLGTTLDSLFPVGDRGEPRLVPNYRLVGLYHAQPAQAPERLPPKEAWLYKRFATPPLLVDAMRQAIASTGIQLAELGLKLYLRTADNALLHWQVPSASSANELFVVDGQTVTDNGNEAALLDGTLSPRDFVRRVIRAGALSVVQQGGLWNTLGPLYDSEHLPLGSGALPLSGMFLTADDAARHAHERIGVRRSNAYAGYVLKRDDGRFVFTEPVAISGDGFASDLLRPANGSAYLVPPAGHQLYARYSSHTALSVADLERQRRLGWTLADLEVNATLFSDVEIRSVIESRLPAYLSGSPNNLISYRPSGSANELLVLSNTRREAGQHGYFERLESGRLKPVDIVARLADAGTLSVLVRSALWGPRGRVYNDWTPNFDYAEVDLQAPAFGAIFDSLDAAALNAHVRWYGRNLDAQRCTAYILKHPQRDEFVVSELLAITSGGRWLSDSSRGVGYLAGGEFAKGFELAGLLFSQQWVPAGLPTPEAWLARFFITPEVLLRAEQDARHLPRPAATAILPVYVSTHDGALLRYQPPASSLLKEATDGTGVIIAGMNLHNGTLDVQRYVSQVAQPADLRVLYTSQCWDRRGAVGQGGVAWRPYANFIRRRLGPAFHSQDDAARHVRSLLQGNGLLGGLILQRPDGLFVATEPLKVPQEDFDPKWIFPDEVVSTGGFPAAHTVVARYRSSPARELPFVLELAQAGLYRNMLSTRVISSALAGQDARLNREYLLGSDGCVVSYTRSHSALEEALRKQLLPLDETRRDRLENLLERQIRNAALAPGEFVTRLANAGVLRVVEGSPTWGTPRRILGAFIVNSDRPAPLAIRNALADPAFSPLFTQEQDAVRYAHQHRRHGEHLQFGYVFKSQKNGHYMVSMPLVRQSYRDFAQVFPDGLFPQGYGLEGFYLCAGSDSVTPATDPLHQAFFSPTDMDIGIRFSIHGIRGKQLTFYLSCADGALLRYQYLGTDAQLDSWGSLLETRQQLRAGRMTLLSYVHRLLDKGVLDTLVRGEVWTTRNRVDTFWKPGVDEVFVPPWRAACGPVFSDGDDAARYLRRQLSPYQGKQYLSAILANAAGTSFLATLPVAAGADQSLILRLFYSGPLGPVQPAVPPAPLPDFPQPYAVAGVHLLYNSMPATDSRAPKDIALTRHFVAPTFLSYFIRVLRGLSRPSPGLYLSSQAGALLKYLPSYSAQESRVLVGGPDVYPTVFLKGVARTGKLFVLDKDDFWMNEGLLSERQVERSNGLEVAVPEVDEPLSLRDRDEL